MSETTIFWLGCAASAVSGVLTIVLVVEFARWLYKRNRRI